MYVYKKYTYIHICIFVYKHICVVDLDMLIFDPCPIKIIYPGMIIIFSAIIINSMLS